MIAVAAPRAPLVQEIPACGVLSVNPYVACDIRCAYCITGAQGASRPRFGPDTVRDQLRYELGALGDRQSRIGLGTLADAYPSVEGELGVTRIVLDELARLRWPVRVVTKGLGVRRDIDLLLRGDGHVTVSVSTLDHDVAARLEPGAPAPTDRLDLIHDLDDAGVPVAVTVTPWIPGVSDVPAIGRRVRSSIPLWVGPLNVVSPEVKRTGFGRRFSQAEIDHAYIEASRASSGRRRVGWLPPITAGAPGNPEQRMAALDRACSVPPASSEADG